MSAGKVAIGRRLAAALAAFRSDGGRFLTTPVESGFRDAFVAVVLAAAYTAVLLATVDRLGYARDEGMYFNAAEAYERWFGLLFSDPGSAIERADEFWRVNAEIALGLTAAQWIGLAFVVVGLAGIARVYRSSPAPQPAG